MDPLKIISMLVKLVELALLVAGMGFVAYFTKESHDDETKNDPTIDPYDLGLFGRYEFFMYTTGVGVVIAVLGFVCALTGLLETKHGALAVSAAQAIWTLQLLVSTALVTKILVTYKKERTLGKVTTSYCEFWDGLKDRHFHYTCGQLIGGVVCGFLAMIAFAVDTVISLFFYGKSLHQYQ